ncbi:MAG: GtrA family protein [Eubacterium sp.]|nr:GtrA family protein [Eubacterium sp.]
MKELFEYLRTFDLKALFITPTTNGVLQFFRYLFVGGAATVVDWAVLFLLTQGGLYYMVSTVIAFLAGLITNFVLSKLLVFKASEARVGTAAEFASYGLIGVIGLGFTMGIMYLLTEKLHVFYMLSKAAATMLVLVWNYLARKLLLYKNDSGHPLRKQS